MHELSLAMSVIDVAAEELRRLGGGRVRAIHLKLGPLAGVAKVALVSAYELAREGTEFSSADMVIQDMPALIYCPACRARAQLPSIQMVRCPACGNAAVEVVSGNELQLSALEMDDDNPPGRGPAECPQA